MTLRTVPTEHLDIRLKDDGDPNGPPVVLLHGFPYDPHAFDATGKALVGRGHRVLVPWLRGFGETRFRDASTPRVGQQAALGSDLRDLLDALGLDRVVVAGYDWGGRAACVVAALWPERVAGLVSCGTGYNIQNSATATHPTAFDAERRHWYWYYLNSAHGAIALREQRHELCRYLWRTFSPTWRFDDATYENTAPAFDNPDFVDVVLHSYRYRIGAAPGAPELDDLEQQLSQTPTITPPTIVLEGAADAVDPPQDRRETQSHFTRLRRLTVLDDIGHNVPQERPDAVTDAVVELTETA